MGKWFSPTINDNRLSILMAHYEIELRDRIERDPIFIPAPGETLEQHLEMIANQLCNGTFDVKQPCFPATLMRLGIPRTVVAVTEFLRGD